MAKKFARERQAIASAQSMLRLRVVEAIEESGLTALDAIEALNLVQLAVIKSERDEG